MVHREGGDPSHERKSPGKTKFDAVTLERGVTHDLAFEQWANLVHSLEAPISLKNFRKDIVVDVFNEADQKVLSYKIFRCWPSEYQALPALDAGTAGVAIQTLKLELEGWERDTSVTEPRRPSRGRRDPAAVPGRPAGRAVARFWRCCEPPASRSPRRSRSARATGGYSPSTAR